MTLRAGVWRDKNAWFERPHIVKFFSATALGGATMPTTYAIPSATDMPMTNDLPNTIAEAAGLIEARALSPLELVQGLLQRIETIDPVIHSFLTVTADFAIDQAREAESEITQGRYRGALHGIPFGLKDIYETAGIRTTGHSKVYENHVPRGNASVVDKLYGAGAILLGKLATHELAHGGPSFDLPWPPARNPWHPEHFTGGSSSGSAAAARDVAMTWSTPAIVAASHGFSISEKLNGRWTSGFAGVPYQLARRSKGRNISPIKARPCPVLAP